MTASTAGAPPVASAEPPRRRGRLRRLATGTPRVIGLLMVVLVVASLAWGVAGVWIAAGHASAASGVVGTNAPLSFEARQMYQSLSDADVTATSAFLAGPDEPLTSRDRYQSDIAQAGADLSDLRAAAVSSSPALGASLSAVATGLPVYTGYVAQAQSNDTLGYPLTGGSFMQVASEQMHLVLLPAANRIYTQVNRTLAARSAQASGLPWIAVALACSVVLGIALLRVQGWLSRRTKRTVNYGLLGATLALLVATVWLLVAFLGVRSDLTHAEAHDLAPAESLAQASIAVQQARNDEVLNLISRSGATSFQGDFNTAKDHASALLASAAGAARGTRAATSIAAASRDATAWYVAGGRVFSLDTQANYAAETKLVIGSGTGSSAARFDQLEKDLSTAIGTGQAAFTSGAQGGSGALTGAAVAFGIAALLMVIGCTWGLSQRLAEYR